MTKGLRIWRSKGLQPTLDTNAYSSGDALGIKTQITGAPDSGVIRTRISTPIYGFLILSLQVLLTMQPWLWQMPMQQS